MIFEVKCDERRTKNERTNGPDGITNMPVIYKMCEKLHIWINYGGVFPSNLPILQFGYCFFYPNYLCVNNEDINCINSSPKMSFLMLLQISLKFWQMCKNSLAIISGTPQFFIRHVNNTRGKWNCHCRLTSRLTGRQGRCDTAQHTVSTAYNIKTSSAPSLPADPQSMSRVIQATDMTPSTLGQGRGRSRE